MIILYVCDLYGDIHHYIRTLAICKHIRPAITIFNGNLLVNKDPDNPIDINNILKVLGEISKLTTLLIQFGGYDLKTNSKMIQKYIMGTSVINITNGHYSTPHCDFCGLSFTSPCFNGPWIAKDSLIDHDKSEIIGEVLIRKQLEICDLSKTIFINGTSPLGILDHDPNPNLHGSYLMRKFCEGDLTDHKQPIPKDT